MTTAWKLVPAEEGKMQVPLLRAVMTATTLILMISPTTAALRRSWSWEWDSTCSLKHSIGFPHRPRFWWGLRNSPVIFAARLSTVTITCRCICGAMDRSTGKDQNRCEAHNPQRFFGFRATVVYKDAATTFRTLDPSHSRISARCKLITNGSTESNLSCVANVVRLSLFEGTGEPMRRTAESCGTALVVQTSNTNAPSKTILELSAMAMLHAVLVALLVVTPARMRTTL